MPRPAITKSAEAMAAAISLSSIRCGPASSISGSTSRCRRASPVKMANFVHGKFKIFKISARGGSPSFSPLNASAITGLSRAPRARRQAEAFVSSSTRVGSGIEVGSGRRTMPSCASANILEVGGATFSMILLNDNSRPATTVLLCGMMKTSFPDCSCARRSRGAKHRTWSISSGIWIKFSATSSEGISGVASARTCQAAENLPNFSRRSPAKSRNAVPPGRRVAMIAASAALA